MVLASWVEKVDSSFIENKRNERDAWVRPPPHSMLGDLRQRESTHPGYLCQGGGPADSSRAWAPGINFPQTISEPELKAANLCYDARKIVKISNHILNITSYYLEDTTSFERVIVIAEVDINGEY